MIGKFSVHPARTPADFAAARSLRDVVYRTRLGLDTQRWSQEEARDRAGHVFLLREHAALVGTGRAVRTDSSLCEIRELGQLPTNLEAATDVCEVGRIATSRCADGIPASLLLLGMGAKWLLQHTDLRRYVSYAKVPVLWLYQKVGAVDLGTRFRIPERGDSEYGVILGELGDAAAAVDRFGAAVARSHIVGG